ncbi:hypothetical protein OGAPHI_002348 [Ogataea philodendri]|uniref:Uncharacterized protein n=1 Tax=Ogataea philodendri TaxID=1378263 RepID=A0A9P8PC85_9ASCO|nr:uncharacterized protein OGAPHI_002348 [Ogataea philodendri]KAH3668594.1 hypothetical protein OGAPHI_002348 [Ogataea philodendri]
MEPSSTGFARFNDGYNVLAHKPSTQKTIHPTNVVRRNSRKKSQIYANKAHFISKGELHAIISSKESLHNIPSHMMTYDLKPSWTQYEYNPVFKYSIVKPTVSNKQLFLDTTDMSIRDYMTPRSVELPNHLNSPLQGLAKYALDQPIKSLPRTNYQLKRSSNRLSTMAEISLESNSEHYNRIKQEIFGRNLLWAELEPYLMTRDDIWNNDYLLTRLLFEIYLRRVVAARLAVKLGSSTAHRGNEHWDEDLISSIYGNEQMSIFREQSSSNSSS